MQELVNKILRILKDHVSQNNGEISLNQEDINRLLARANTHSNSDQDDLEYKKLLNEELLQENEEFINMQIQLTEFMEKFGHLIEYFEDPDEEYQEEEAVMPYFTQTINGNIEFGPEHPQFSNPEFFSELLRYYEEREEYEKCDRLVRMKRANLKF